MLTQTFFLYDLSWWGVAIVVVVWLATGFIGSIIVTVVTESHLIVGDALKYSTLGPFMMMMAGVACLIVFCMKMANNKKAERFFRRVGAVLEKRII